MDHFELSSSDGNILIRILLDDDDMVERAHVIWDSVGDTLSSATSEVNLTIEIIERFIRFGDLEPRDLLILNYVLEYFQLKFIEPVSGGSIHSFCAERSDGEKLLGLYFEAINRLKEGAIKPKKCLENPIPSLFKGAKEEVVGLFIQFGGHDGDYLPSLRSLYRTYPSIRNLINDITEILMKNINSNNMDPDTSLHYSFGFNLSKWLIAPNSAPPRGYLCSAPVSYPLIGLTQIAHYYKTVLYSGLTFSEFTSLISGATGHGQGLIAAAVASVSVHEVGFIENVKNMVKYLFWHGCRVQSATGLITNYGKIVSTIGPTHMLSIEGMTSDFLNKELKDHFGDIPGFCISNINGPTSFVVSGPPSCLSALKSHLVTISVKSGVDQSNIPFSKRKPCIVVKWLKSSVPMHHPSLDKNVKSLILDDINLLTSFHIASADLEFPVYSTDKVGFDLKSANLDDIVPDIVDMQLSLPLVWHAATRNITTESGISHVFDFGPDTTYKLTERALEGTGIRVLNLSDPDEFVNMLIEDPIEFANDWREEFEPRIVLRSINEDDNREMISTKWTDKIGKPPLLLAGMTPTTSLNGVELVAAATNAGFHAELAGGALTTPSLFEEKVLDLHSQLHNGEGININIIYSHSDQWTFQFDSIMKMLEDCVPIDSITLSGTLPTLDRSNQIVRELQKAGLRFISFKPRTANAILSCIDIARDNPSFTFCIQWSGGRGGGHHSFEDFHQPILQTYSNIRALENTVLVAGSGFGDAEGCWPYLSGTWSERYHRGSMPFDAVLLASRMMVSKEAPTSYEVKKLITQTEGVGCEKDWENTYEGDTGGIVSVVSESGQPIHKIANRAMVLWKEFDRDIFSLENQELVEFLDKNRAHIIAKINKDFQKPYFGKKMETGDICDLGEMTYADVAMRLIEMCHIYPEREIEIHSTPNEITIEGAKRANYTPNGRWIDLSYLDKLFRWIRLSQEHFGSEDRPVFGHREELREDPLPKIKSFIDRYPAALTQLLTSKDIDVFLHMCKHEGKPVPFIPVIDVDLEYWFKKDSLWYSEDLAAVPGNDAERVCILQGPVSVRYSKHVNESVADIFNDIHDTWVVLAKTTLNTAVGADGGDDVPIVPYLGAYVVNDAFSKKDFENFLDIRSTNGVETVVMPSDISGSLPDEEEWLEYLAGPESTWLRAILFDSFIISNNRRIPNRIPLLFHPRYGQSLVIRKTGNVENYSIRLSDENVEKCLTGVDREGICTVDLSLVNGNMIHIMCYDSRPRLRLEDMPTYTALNLVFKYQPHQAYALIHEEDEDSKVNEARLFYKHLWLPFDDKDQIGEIIDIHDVFQAKYSITPKAVKDFNKSIGAKHGKDDCITTVDFAMVACWGSLVKCLLANEINGNMLKMVHLSNALEMLPPNRDTKGNDKLTTFTNEPEVYFTSGNDIHSTSYVSQVEITRQGKVITCVSVLRSNKQSSTFMKVTSTYLFKGRFVDYHNCFRRNKESVNLVVSENLLSILESKQWFKSAFPTEQLLQISATDKTSLFTSNDILEFQLSIDEDNLSTTLSNIHIFGVVVRKATPERPCVTVADINVRYSNVPKNPILEFLKRWQLQIKSDCSLASGGYYLLDVPHKATAPTDAAIFARGAFDWNPVNRNPYFSSLLGASSPPIHAMWVSSNARRVLDATVKKGGDTIHSFACSFDGVVEYGDVLFTQLKHVENKNGRKIIEVECVKGDGDIVLTAKAAVNTARTAYVFGGGLTGIASIGMGMALFEESIIAQEVWKNANQHMLESYGFSIIDIVRKNPESLTVYFGGRKGAKVRKNYMKLRVENKDGETVQLLPNITEFTPSFTFKSKYNNDDGGGGILNMPPFIQPISAIMELAMYEDMKANGLIPIHHDFAGHGLGEFVALGASSNVFDAQSLAEIAFLRALHMYYGVEREKDGFSPYVMVDLNVKHIIVNEENIFAPSIIDEVILIKFIAEIAKLTNHFIELASFNVTGRQYTIAGHKFCIIVLVELCNALNKDPELLDSWESWLVKKVDDVRLDLSVEDLRNISFTPTLAITPIQCNDVPCNTSYHSPLVRSFRSILQSSLSKSTISTVLPELLGKYIPNIVAEPFQLSKRFCELVAEQTGSTALHSCIEKWELVSNNLNSLAHILLVELLAYQLVCPIRWAKTQDTIFRNNKVQRVIEIGSPDGVLKSMALVTLNSSEYSQTYCEVLEFFGDNNELYYNIKTTGPSARDAASNVVSWVSNDLFAGNNNLATDGSSIPPLSTPLPLLPINIIKGNAFDDALPEPTSPTLSAVSGITDTPLLDAPATPIETIKVLVTLKCENLSFSDILPTDTIKSICDGTSGLEEDLMNDLESEFVSLPDKASELSLQELSDLLSGYYTTLGRVTVNLVATMIATHLPRGYSLSSLTEYLTSERLLTPGRMNSVMLRALVNPPSTELLHADDVLKWIERVVDAYGDEVDATIPNASSLISNKNHNGAAKTSNTTRQRLNTLVANNVGSQLKQLRQRLDNQDNVKSVSKTHISAEREREMWIKEHGEFYHHGITPMFSEQKQLVFDSYWNWGRIDVLEVYNNIISGKNIDSYLAALVRNRGSKELLLVVHQIRKEIKASKHHSDLTIESYCDRLESEIHTVLLNGPRYIARLRSTSPCVTIDSFGNITYKETLRDGIISVEDYIYQMKLGYEGSILHSKQSSDMLSSVTQDGITMSTKLSKRNHSSGRSFQGFVHLKTANKDGTGERAFDSDATRIYYEAMHNVATSGISFVGKVILVTGCRMKSIAAELLKPFLLGGAHVIATSSDFSTVHVKFYRDLYEKNCSKDSKLTLLPFNQGSSQDINSIVTHIYENLDLDIEFVIPFAGINEDSGDIHSIDSRSEYSHRVLLTNVVRLLGAIKSHKHAANIVCRPAMVMLPLSPNHAIFGTDGLYSESKLALEALLNKWEIEGWEDYLSIVGVVMGWTRGVDLMEGNNLVSAGIENLGVRTFSVQEMCFNIITLFHPKMVQLSQNCPIWADLGGRLDIITQLNHTIKQLKNELDERSSLQRAITLDAQEDLFITDHTKFNESPPLPLHQTATNAATKFPDLPSVEEVTALSAVLQNMVDLHRTVVCVGYGEVGPWGSSRTRWEMESYGTFSLEGCIELAWMLGFIQYDQKELSSGNLHIGWVDSRTRDPVRDIDVKSIYETEIMKSSGIRLVDTSTGSGGKYSSSTGESKSGLLQQVSIPRDLKPVEVSSQEDAEEYLSRVGSDNCDIFCNRNGVWHVVFKRGAVLTLPRALRYKEYVAAQVPNGWDANRFGISDEIKSQLDNVTLYSLVSTMEAFLAAGVIDPYEFYKYVHLSRIGNTFNGGTYSTSTQQLLRERMTSDDLTVEIMRDTSIESYPAWLNMMLLSSSGPVKTPVGACSTTVESIEVGVQSIQSGKSSIVIVGGNDVLSTKEPSGDGGRNNLETTSRPPSYTRGSIHSYASSRSEHISDTATKTEGAGNQILMSASVALEMGVPIYAIIGLARSSSTTESRRISAADTHTKNSEVVNPLLNIDFRRNQLNREYNHAREWFREENASIIAEAASKQNSTTFIAERSEALDIEFSKMLHEAQNKWGNAFFHNEPTITPIQGSLSVFNLTVEDIVFTSILQQPSDDNGLRDDEHCEYEAIHNQMEDLRRSPGNPLYCVTPKHITGHSTGAAVAWMVNSTLQAIQENVVPGNDEINNIHQNLRQFNQLVYPNRHMKLAQSINAALVKISSGSNTNKQLKTDILIIHPKYIYGVADLSIFDKYKDARSKREKTTFRYIQNTLTSKETFVQLKAPPFAPEQEPQIYSDPKIRARYDPSTRSYSFNHAFVKKDEFKEELLSVGSPVDTVSFRRTSVNSEEGGSHSNDVPTSPSLSRASIVRAVSIANSFNGLNVILKSPGHHQDGSHFADEVVLKDKGVGIDMQGQMIFENAGHSFLKKHFRDSEIAFCKKEDNSAIAFAGRWAAKEAVIKAICDVSDEARSCWKESGVGLRDIEIIATTDGQPPLVKFHRNAAKVAKLLGVHNIKISISHAGDISVAFAVILQ